MAGSSYADEQVFESVEWKTLQSDSVIIASIDSFSPYSNESIPTTDKFSPVMEWIHLDVKETLSGDSVSGKIQVLYLDYSGRKAEIALHTSTPKLFFLKRGVKHKWLSRNPENHNVLSITNVGNEVEYLESPSTMISADSSVLDKQSALDVIRSVNRDAYKQIPQGCTPPHCYYESEHISLTPEMINELDLHRTGEPVFLIVPKKK